MCRFSAVLLSHGSIFVDYKVFINRAPGDSGVPVSAVHQEYETEVHNVYTIRGNAAVFSCQVPSYVSEFVTVREWHTAAGAVFRPGREHGNSSDLA